MNLSSFHHLGAVYNSRHIFRNAPFLACFALLLTQMLPAQDGKASKIPEGEAQFTPGSRSRITSFARIRMSGI